jgi:formylglycine-generating enzyme required for sulfatase activity
MNIYPKLPAKPDQPESRQRRQLLQWLGLSSMGGIASLLWADMLKSQAEAALSLNSQFSSITKSAQIKALQTIQFKTIKLNDRGEVIARPTTQVQLYQENLGHGISLTMVKIPAGSFIMGASSQEQGSDPDEQPQHQVKLKEFYLSQTVVTQAQYQALMGENPSNFTGQNHPVELVSWQKAQEFCQKLTAKTGKAYCLPSESQWEYACRAGTTTPFAFGAAITTDVANYNGKFTYGQAPQGIYRMTTTAVGQFPPNAFGLYDMHGNVWEWCADSWYENYQGAPIDGSARVRQSGRNSDLHILRGGSWYRDPWVCRSADRFKGSADGIFNYVGFRVLHSREDLAQSAVMSLQLP